MKRDFRVCLNNRGFSTFLFKAQLIQCIELESIISQLTEQILIWLLVSHLEVLKLVYFSYINNSFPVLYV